MPTYNELATATLNSTSTVFGIHQPPAFTSDISIATTTTQSIGSLFSVAIALGANYWHSAKPPVLGGSIGIAASATQVVTARVLFSASINLRETLLSTVRNFVADSLNVAGVQISTSVRHRTDATLGVAGVQSSAKITQAPVSARMLFNAELLRRVKQLADGGGFGLNAAAIQTAIARVLASSSWGLASTAFEHLTGGGDLATSAINFDTEAMARLIALELATSGVHLTSRAIDAEGAAGWTAQLETFGMSRYTTPEIESVAVINGVLYGCGSNGIYAMQPNVADASGQVNAEVRTGLIDMGSALTRPQHFYMSYSSSGRMELVLAETGSGTELSYAYQFAAQSASAQVPHRVTLGRGIRSRYLRFIVKNVDGAPFEVTSAFTDKFSASRKV